MEEPFDRLPGATRRRPATFPTTYGIVFLADNPGIWMDHCHHLDHAVEGLVAHLAYAGVTGSYEVGGPADNQPE